MSIPCTFTHSYSVAMKKCLVACFLFAFYSILVAQDCPLPSPSDVDVKMSLEVLLTIANGDIKNGYNVSVMELNIVCKAQGSAKDTYRYISAIAVYTPYLGAPQNTSIFQLDCFNDTWSPVADEGLHDPSDTLIQNNVSRSDCAVCGLAHGDDRCGGKLNFHM